MKALLLSFFVISSTWAMDIEEIKDKLVGTYAHYDVVKYVAPLFGPIKLKSRIISFGITEYYLENGELWTKDRFCFSDYKANLPFKSLTKDEFTQAIVPKVAKLEILKTNGEVRIYRPETPTLLGVDLDDYTQDFPPVDSPLYIDDDGDGKPGVTVNLTMGPFLNEELYIARKEIFSYDAKLNDNGIISGIVRDRSQQMIIGASKPNLAKPNNPPQDLDLSKSPIYLVPLKEDYDCDKLKRDRKKLFPKSDKKAKRFYKKFKL